MTSEVCEKTENSNVAQNTQNPIEAVIKAALAHHASDVHFKAGMPPVFRIDGRLTTIAGFPKLEPAYIKKIFWEVLSPEQCKALETNMELDTAIVIPNLARVRLNLYMDLNSIGCAMRIVPFRIPTLSELGMPAVVEKLTAARAGLILVTGVTGAGKSTTLAAMVDAINRRDSQHIYTIEDPVEFVHTPIRSVITQREVGLNTKSFGNAVRAALRADPNVLMIGEMRDSDTILSALKAAETGLLVLSTLHTVSAAKTIQRILAVFDPVEQEAVRMQLAYCLKAVICQQLLPMPNRGRKAVQEIMVHTQAIQEAILQSEYDKLTEYIRNGAYDGMQSMDSQLYEAFASGAVEGKTAIDFAINREEMERSLKAIN